MEIDEVEAYIESEKHLPWVTSAQNEEENAVNMTRMGFETLEALENLQMQIRHWILLFKLRENQIY
jgi:hypothetical protein